MGNVNKEAKTGIDGNNGYDSPLWANRAKYLDHKPDFVDGIPDRLKQLGEVFFPIPRRKKGWKYPHSVQEYRHAWDSKELNAYLEAGWNYGIACADDIVVVDIDEIEWRNEILERLPPSMHQQTGSGEGYHVFYRVEGFDRGATLKTKEELHGESNVEVGDIKGHRHSYVVGPGSVHPSGNEYGPLVGDEIAEVDKDTMLQVVEDFSGDGYNGGGDGPYTDWSELDTSDTHDFYELEAHEVAPDMTAGGRTSNPFHGSSTGTNFMMNEDGTTFTCWRCQHGHSDGCGLNGVHYLAGIAIKDELSNYHCEHIRHNWYSDHSLHWKAWKEAVKAKLVDPTDPPYSVIIGFAEKHSELDNPDGIPPRRFHHLKEQTKYVSVQLARANR